MNKLENWRIITQFSINDSDPKKQDEVLIMSGQLNGEWILTDPLVIFDVENRSVTTRGRHTYKLGITACL